MRKKEKNPCDSVSCLKGVGPQLTMRLRERGIATVEDLLYLLPLRYDDRRRITPLSEVEEGIETVVTGRVIRGGPAYYQRKAGKAFDILISDETGRLFLKWFQWSYAHLSRICRKDVLLLAAGRVTRFGPHLQMIHPHITILDCPEELEQHRGIVTVYPELEGIKPADLRKIVAAALDWVPEETLSLIPPAVAERQGLSSLSLSLSTIHRPHDPKDLNAPDKGSVERLIIEEYFLCQCALLLRKAGEDRRGAAPLQAGGRYFHRVMERLPFELTGGQKAVIDAIRTDMKRTKPMNRLLQGDVGSGKTICAVLASCLAIDGGCQVALMAPTEILAEQHYLEIHRTFEELGLKVAFLRGDMGKEGRRMKTHVASGEAAVVVGTQALLEGDVLFARLGLVIIDEQHRFGVLQRKTLQEKWAVPGPGEHLAAAAGTAPHVLVMTATPIPRTLSMVIYGDLDVSLLTGMPAGRRKVATKVFRFSERGRVFESVGKELEQGRQAFVVYPLVDESETMDLLDARRMADHLSKDLFPAHSIGLLHGKMRPREKEALMADFRAGKVDLLACTTVIEVGIDVPNATVIVIEHAERFGLSQLHQLRGRVGRGPHASQCLLVAGEDAGDGARQRLGILERTNDGFVIAEEDMRLRGPGEMLGVRQSGLPDFRVGNLLNDGHLMAQARRMAAEMLEGMDLEEKERIRQRVVARFGEGFGIGRIA